MKHRALTLLPALILGLALTSTAWAQPQAVHGIDPGAAIEILGTVETVAVGFGDGMPTVTVDDATLGSVTVRLGPIWVLQQAGLVLAPGNEVEILAYPCTLCTTGLVAAWITDLASGLTVELRDDAGYPLWMQAGHGPTDPRCRRDGAGSGEGLGTSTAASHGPGGGSSGPGGPGNANAQGPGDGEPKGPNDDAPATGAGDGGPWMGPGRDEDRGFGGQCAWSAPDVAAAVTVTGTIVSVETFRGAPPALTLATPGGDLELVIAPFGPVAAAGFLLTEGAELTVTYAPWLWDEAELLVVIALTDPDSGVTIQLRDPETGLPLGQSHGRW